MNYRHAFHAGNFADIHKHCLLIAVVNYLKQKDKAFWVLDTHAGIGRYDLTSDEAIRTGEFHLGIERLMNAVDLPEDARTLCSIVRSINDDASLRFYPGSPAIVRALLRRQDRLVACELHPEDAGQLKDLFAGDRQVKVHHLDGYLAFKAFLPPKIRRGMVLIDPPYEKRDEFEQLAAALTQAHKRWPGGTFMLWYPIKELSKVAAFHRVLRDGEIPNLLRSELLIRSPGDPDILSGSGLIIANPPWTLAETARPLMAALCPILALDRGADWRLDWLTPPL